MTGVTRWLGASIIFAPGTHLTNCFWVPLILTPAHINVLLIWDVLSGTVYGLFASPMPPMPLMPPIKRNTDGSTLVFYTAPDLLPDLL